jgi:hypothetical protein
MNLGIGEKLFRLDITSRQCRQAAAFEEHCQDSQADSRRVVNPPGLNTALFE